MSPVDNKSTAFTAHIGEGAARTHSPPHGPPDAHLRPTSAADSPEPPELPQPPQQSVKHHKVLRHKNKRKIPKDQGDKLAGWGKGGDRFGGMAQAGLGQDPAQLEHGAGATHPHATPSPGRAQGQVLNDDASATSTDSTGSYESVSVSGSEAEENDDEADRRGAASVDEGFARRERAEKEKSGAKAQQGSKSFYGGSGQGYMRMLHTLAQQDSDDDSSRSPSRRHRASPPPLNTSGLQKPRQAAIYTTNGPPIPNSPTSPASPQQALSPHAVLAHDEEQGAEPDAGAASASASDEDAEHTDDHAASSSAEDSPQLSEFISPPERAAQNPSLARCPSEYAGAGVAMDASAVSSGRAHEHERRKRRKGRRAGAGTDLSKSSIFAIQPSSRSRSPSRSPSVSRSRISELTEDEHDSEHDGAERPRAPKRSDTAGTASTSATARAERQRERRERLAEKLAEVFGLEEREEVIAEYPCWLFRSILLQGFLYITAGHLCFYAYLKQKEGATIRSGSLSIRGNKTRRYHKHWFVLRDSVLSWFPSSTDPYFPDGHIDLHYCLSIEPSTKHDHHFKITTSEKKHHFKADSTASRDEWVKTLKKVVFRCQNEGEAVKIAIPLETVLDVEKSSGLEFAETIRVRVYDPDEGFEIDEYWLSYFKDLDAALDKINDTLERFRAETQQEVHPPSPIEDTTKRAKADLGETDQVKEADGERGEGTPEHERHRSKTLSERVTSVLEETGLKRNSSRSSRASVKSAPPPPAASAPAKRSSGDSLQQLTLNTRLATMGGTAAHSGQPGAARDGSSTATPVAGSVATLRPPQEEVAAQGVSPIAAAAANANDLPLPPPVSTGIETGAPPALGKAEQHSSTETVSTVSASVPAPAPSTDAEDPLTSSLAAVPPAQHAPSHTYPPEPSPHGPSASEPPATRPARSGSTLSRFLSPPTQAGRKILEVVTRRGGRSASEGDVVGGPIVEEPEEVGAEGEGAELGEEERKGEEFRKTFGLKESEELIEQFPAYLFRGLPVYGRVYISSNFFCFKSTVGPLTKTKMILPINDIIGVSKHRSYRIGFSGLMVVIKGHEEVFLELSNSDRRDACLAKLEHQREVVRALKRDKAEQEDKEDDPERRELQDLLDLSASKSSDPALDNPHPKSEAVPGQPPIMFSSTTSDFVTFRPEKSLRFTCLTIGSRGDVQPYIALCKGLMAQGHKCKIASHGEYRKWVEGHGIEFSAVGGDPAELMQLMISHDFFTVSFMKEAVGRFRGWLDDLLASAWKGCQNTDVLIESPSAIAGYHIAEALQVPYYRAFTMPWSRTRAYPHAFAVPEVHMGGGYNYMTYTMFDQVFWRATSGQVNRWRKETLKIRSTSLEAMAQHKIPFLYNFSPVVIPPPLDWRENIHVTGYWWLDNPDDSKSKKWEPPEELLRFLDEAEAKDKKVVFIGFGSIIIPDPLEMTRVVAQAVERADVYAIVAKGWSDRANSKGDSEDEKKQQEEREQQEKELMDKPFLHNVKSIPHDWLFPRINAAVHHGGAGTTGASLRAGLPTIIKPFFGDQHFYADRVSTLGIGTHIRNFTVDNLSEALVTAVTDEKQIERARLAGEEIRKEDGVATAIECIYRDLEYARSLIPPPSDPGKDTSTEKDDDRDDEKDDETLNDETRSDDKSKAGVPQTPVSKTRSRSPERKTSTSSPQNESRTTSSDEGWDVMSRGSAADTTWEHGSASRASSMTRSREASAQDVTEHDQHEEAGTAETEPQSGLTARMLSMLGKKQTR